MKAQQLLESIRPLVVDDGEAPGAVVGVLQGGETSVAAVGAIEPGGAIPMTPDSVMRISSNTKPMAAAVALLLIQHGVLRLDDLVETFIPELADRRVLRRLDSPVDDTLPAARHPTIEDLLTMRLGFGFVFESECPAVEAAATAGLGFGPPDPSMALDSDEWISRLASLPLLEQPGTVWRYEIAYAVLGVVLSRASGKPLEILMRELLFDPLAMSKTGFVDASEDLVPAFSRGAEGLVLFDGAENSRWSIRPAFPDARSGLVSTAGDMLAFARMLLQRGGGLISPELVTAMTSSQLTPEQQTGPSAQVFLNGGSWGYGLGVTQGKCGRRYGWGGGLGTLWHTWPDHDTAIVLMTQVLPPSTAIFDAITSAAESSMRRRAAL